MRTAPNRRAAALAAMAAFGIATSAAALPFAARSAGQAAAATDVITVEAVHRKHHRRAYPDGGPPADRAGLRSAPGCPGLYSWNPANPNRGFCDPGFAYHGNINGCVIDQGYGRWASCDTLR
jgi:hypothetical protein